MKPTRIELINDTLAVVWDDGHESYYECEPLRRQCPCAVCQGETNVLSATPPAPPAYRPASFQLARWQFVGGYALQLHWGDGHATGLYSFDYLRRLCQCAACRARASA